MKKSKLEEAVDILEKLTPEYQRYYMMMVRAALVGETNVRRGFQTVDQNHHLTIEEGK